MNFIDGLNYQNYTTIDKTREITEKLVESKRNLERIIIVINMNLVFLKNPKMITICK